MSTTINQLNLIYEDIIFEHNLNILCEEINYLTSIITEENFWETIKSIFSKIEDFFSKSVEIFKKGYQFIVDFTKSIFQLTHIKNIMNKLGITDSMLRQFVEIAKASLIVIPVAKIGYGVVERTYKDIKDNDVAILIDREAFNKKSKELFSEQDFLEKTWTIFKSGTKAIFAELIASIPLILKCVTGYAIATGIEETIKDPVYLSSSQKKTLQFMGDVNNELGKGHIKTDTQIMAHINQIYQCGGPGAFNMFARSNLMKAWDVYGSHYNKTNHGAVDIFNGTRTTFKGNAASRDLKEVSNADGKGTHFEFNKNSDGEYVTEKLSPTEFWYEIQKQTGMGESIGIPFGI